MQSGTAYGTEVRVVRYGVYHCGVRHGDSQCGTEYGTDGSVWSTARNFGKRAARKRSEPEHGTGRVAEFPMNVLSVDRSEFVLSEVDPAWLSRVVAAAEAGTSTASAAATSSSGEQLTSGGYQGSWATSADGAPEASGSAMALDGSGSWCRWSN